MRYLTKTLDFDSRGDSVVTLGKFDGLHRGHMLLIRRVLAIGRTEGLETVVFTFDVPPQSKVQHVKPELSLELMPKEVREELEQGNMEAVSGLLGYDYAVHGEIVHGHALGRTIGVPTINQIPPAEKLLPPFGVYVSEVKIEGKIYYGITNIGVKPTVQEKFTGVETNLFDCSEDLYGKQAEVSLLKFLRPEQKFASIDALKNQLNHDVAAGKKYVEKKFAQQ